MSTQIQIRRDTTANWESVNPVLADGEIGYDTTANKFKVGNGTDAWLDIEYSGASGSELVDGEAYIRLEDGSWVASPSMTFEGDLTINGNITIDGGQIVDPDGNPAGGAPAVHVGDTAPADPVEGQQWFNTDNGTLYIYYENNGDPEWVSASGGSSSGAPAVHVGDTAPADPVEGQQWLNTDDGYLYVYYGNAGNPTWMAVEREQ